MYLKEQHLSTQSETERPAGWDTVMKVSIAAVTVGTGVLMKISRKERRRQDRRLVGDGCEGAFRIFCSKCFLLQVVSHHDQRKSHM